MSNNFFVLDSSADREDPEGDVAGSAARTLTFRDANGRTVLGTP